jgi:enoyl-CoA hydratase/carnithine racemase
VAASLAREGDVHLINLGDGENRLDREALRRLHGLLDEVESASPPRALATVARGKFWCNGFDQDWMAANPGQVDDLLQDFRDLLARLVTLPVATVAGLQGHAFAAGAMLALAHDFRVIRDDRGYFCLPEIDLRRALSPASIALLQAKVPPPVVPELLIAGRRYGGADAVNAGLAVATASADELASTAVELAATLASKDPPTLATMKQRAYGSVVERLRDEDPSS